jgi:hypothetical protein
VVSSEVRTSTCLTDDGRVDCVAIWVDYDLTPVTINSTPLNDIDVKSHCASATRIDSSSANIHHQWDEIKQDFPPHLKVNLKFFEAPKVVHKNKTFLSTLTKFNIGDSDFKYEFELS